VSHGRGRGPVRERPRRVHQDQVRRLRGLCLARQRRSPARLPSGQQAQDNPGAGHGILYPSLAESAAGAASKGRYVKTFRGSQKNTLFFEPSGTPPLLLKAL